MKRVLITGENSYIGTSVAKWLEKSPDEFEVTTISVRGEEWKNHDFSQYDTVFHVAGIAHRKKSKEVDALHWKVNYELTKQIAEKARENFISHFIFLSSMSVFGKTIGEINSNTECKPTTEYGKSKYEAENYLKRLETSEFAISIVRPPMVYGFNCNGNYMQLSKLAKITPIFAEIENTRSMIFIENLAVYIQLLISNRLAGNFHPQNIDYVKTSSLVRYISLQHNKKIYFTRLFNPIIKFLSKGVGVIPKVFGSLYYSQSLNINELPIELQQELQVEMIGFKLSIKKSELEDNRY